MTRKSVRNFLDLRISQSDDQLSYLRNFLDFIDFGDFHIFCRVILDEFWDSL